MGMGDPIGSDFLRGAFSMDCVIPNEPQPDPTVTRHRSGPQCFVYNRNHIYLRSDRCSGGIGSLKWGGSVVLGDLCRYRLALFSRCK